MKKVLIAYDGINFPKGAFSFARQLNRISPILLTGVFLPQNNYASLWSYANALSGSSLIPLVEEEQAAEINNNMERFKSMCQTDDIAFRIHKKYYGISIAEMPMETRFADLLLLGGEKFQSSLLESEHNSHVIDMLKNTECPVMVIPEGYKNTNMNILAYDGSSSSMFAIKQFTYLFPELSHNETTLVYIDPKDSQMMPDQDYIMEYASQHYSRLTFETIPSHPGKKIAAWLDDKPNAILVSGACGRSFISEMVKESFIIRELERHQHTVFIAHK